MEQPPTSPEGPTLVTGATGFAGCHLVAALLQRGERVVGLSRTASWPAAWRRLAGRASLKRCDLCDAGAAEAALREIRPARIYHLAGFASVHASFRDPEAAWAGNLTATRRLCEAVLRTGARPRLLHVSSAQVYGPLPAEGAAAFTEDSPLCPDSPYAASKAAADLACFQYARGQGLDVVRARPFNHAGPHQSAEFAISSFARQIAAIARGQAPAVLETGDLTAQRDLCDVRDVASAYMLLMERGRTGEVYNVASGQSWSMRGVLDRLLALAGLRVEVRTQANRLRPGGPACIRGDAGKLRREIGWSPRYSLEQTLADTLAAWREQAP